MRRFLWLVPVTAVLAAASEARAQTPAPQTQLDALAKLNGEFRLSYSNARSAVLRTAYPILLYDGSKLVLLAGAEKRLEGTPVPVIYHRLKALAHLPFTLYLELRDVDGELSGKQQERLIELRRLIAEVEKEFPTYEFGTYAPDRQRRLLDRSTALVDLVLDRRECSRRRIEEFARELGPDMHANTLAAAEVELGHHHAEIRAWSADLTDDERQRLRVVVCGSQMPRSGHRIVQLAAALLGEPGEGKKIAYAEAIYEEQRALNLLGTRLLDSESAAAFFDDATRLNRDILAEGAARYVREHIGVAKP